MHRKLEVSGGAVTEHNHFITGSTVVLVFPAKGNPLQPQIQQAAAGLLYIFCLCLIKFRHALLGKSFSKHSSIVDQHVFSFIFFNFTKFNIKTRPTEELLFDSKFSCISSKISLIIFWDV